MTVYLRDGQWLLVNGQLATGGNCCCGGCCCVEGAPDPAITTAEACAAAGGTWNAGKSCDNPCFCCSYRVLCLEMVESHVGPHAGPAVTGWFDPSWADAIPAAQPEGTILVFTEAGWGNPAVKGCAGSSPGKQNITNAPCYDDDPCGDGNFYFRQWYYRLRAVDSCDECTGADPSQPQTPLVVESEMQFPGGKITCCLDDGVAPVDVASCEECDAYPPPPGQPPGGGRPSCNTFDEGCPVNRVTAMACYSLTASTCATRDQSSPSLPTFSDCVEESEVSLCSSPAGCEDGYWVMDVADCMCQPGDIPEGVVADPELGTLQDPNAVWGDYGWTSRDLCCDERVASGLPPCPNPLP